MSAPDAARSPAATGGGSLEGLLLELFPAAVVALDAAGRVRSWNARAERYFGRAAADVVGRLPEWIESPLALDPSASSSSAPPAASLAPPTEAALRGEWMEVVRPDGVRRSLLLERFHPGGGSAEASPADDGASENRLGELRLYWSVEDAAAAPTTAVWQRLLDHSGQILFAKDAALRNVVVNRLYLEAVGLPAEDVLGKTLAEVAAAQHLLTAAGRNPDPPSWAATQELARDRAVQSEAYDRRALETGGPVEYDVRFSNSAGERILKNRKTAFRDSQGRTWGVLGVSWDETAVLRARTELIASERRHRRLVEYGLEAVTLYDADGDLVYYTPNTVQILGRLPVNVMGEDGRKVLFPGDFEKLLGIYARLMARPDEPIFGERIRVTRPDGGWRWLEFNLHNLLADPEVKAIVANWRDVSERRRAEEELVRREERLKLALEGGNLGLFERESQTGPMWISAEASRLMGFGDEPRMLSVEEQWNSVHPEDRDMIRAIIPSTPDGGFSMEHRIVRPDGSIRWVHTVCRVRLDPDPDRRRLVGVVQDVTEHKLAVTALHRSEERFRLAAVAANDTIWEYDVAAYTIELAGNVSPYLESGPQIVPFDWWIDRIHPDDRPRATAEFDEQLADDVQSAALEYRIRRVDGGYSEVSDRYCILRDRQGAPRRLIGAWTDVTQLREAERTLQNHLRLLKEVTNLQGGYIAGASHHQQFSQMVSTLVDLTRSEFGFIGEIMMDEEGAPYLNVIALTNIAWTPEMRVRIANIEREPVEFRNLDNLFGAVILSGQPVIANDPARDPRRGGIPEGHPPLKSFLGAPCYLGTRFVGMVGLGNRPGGYDHAVLEPLQPLLSTIALIMAAARGQTERTRAEEALRESEARLRQLTEGIDHITWLRDKSGAFLYISPNYDRLWGRSAERLRLDSEDWLQAVVPEDRERARAYARGSFARGKYHQEYRIRRPDGSIRCIRDRAYPIMDERGRLVRLAGVTEDVTHWKELQQRLHDQADMLDKARSAILVTNLAGEVVYANDFSERLYGWSLAEMLGKPLVEFMETKATEDSTEIRESLAENGEWRGESAKRTRGGLAVIVEESRTLVRSEDGAPRSILRIHSDVTERKRMQTQVLRQQRLESIGTLAGGIAHDLNNALTPTRLALGLIEEEAPPEQRRHLLKQAQAGIDRSVSMVRRILEFARGKDTPRAPSELEPVFDELERMLAATFPKTVRLSFRVVRPLSRVLADPTQISQVLMNLCLNARDAMPDGGDLVVSAENVALDDRAARRLRLARGGPYVAVEVVDRGEGMSKEVMERIFDPFFTTKEPGRGAGLGLSMSQTIIRQHGGAVDVESEPGAGTVFRLWFPACDLPPAPEPPVPAPGRVGQGELILFVDDEPSIRETAQAALQRAGYVVTTATNGVEALSQFVQQRGKVSAAVVDLVMPIMDGPAVVQALRSIHAGLPILITTGHAPTRSLDGKGVARTPVLAKPYTREQLVEAVGSLLRGGETAG